MATREVSGLIKYKDAAGNLYLMLPVTTKDNVEGLENIDNTADTDKPVSSAQATAIADAKKAGTDAQSSLNTHTSNKSNPHSVTKAQVGLGNVPNVATNDQTPTYSAASTLATLTSGEKLSVSMGKIMKAITDFISHKSSTSNPHSVTKSQVGLGNVDNTADTDKPVSSAQATAIADAKKAGTDAQSSLSTHTSNKSNPHGVTAAQVGLGNVNNTSDANKPISTATQAALDDKADSDHSHDAGPDPITTAGSGAAYTATVKGIAALTAGVSFMMKPHTVSTSTAPTLNVNGLGAKNLRCRLSNSTATTTTGGSASWLAANKPVRVTYDGTYWIADVFRPNMADAYGTLQIPKGGTGATDAATALANLGAAPAEHVHSYIQFVNKELSIPKHPDTFDFDAWESIAYGNGKFVAVGSNGNAAYSTDGINWTPINMYFSDEITENIWMESVAFGNGKFVAVGRANYDDTPDAAYSTDGINWTQTYLQTDVIWYSIAYGNGKFVAVGSSGNAAYSTDGINWTQTSMPISYSTTDISITFGNGKFVVVAYDGTAAYSTDGINWTQTSMPSSSSWRSIAYGNSMFVVAGSGKIAYSADGINWTETNISSAKTEALFSIAYGGDKFVAVGRDRRSKYSCTVYSTDGINWTLNTLEAQIEWGFVCYGDGKFVAVPTDNSVNTDTTVAMISMDGINWKNEYVGLMQDGQDVTEAVKTALGI